MAASSPPTVVAHLQHDAHGRVRVRVRKEDRQPDTYERIRRHVERQPGVSSVTVSGRTGSVLVEAASSGEARAALAGVLEVLGPPESARALEPEVGLVVDFVRTADARLRVASAGRLSLRWMVPAAFVTLGVRQLMRHGLTIGNVPWYVLLYYGADSFLKLYPDHAPRPAVAAVERADGQ